MPVGMKIGIFVGKMNDDDFEVVVGLSVLVEATEWPKYLELLSSPVDRVVWK